LFEPPARTPPRDEGDAPKPPRALGLSRVRVVPDFENGVVVGLRLFGIRRDGLFALLGFENGDRLD
jgi:hypothetical protein